MKDKRGLITFQTHTHIYILVYYISFLFIIIMKETREKNTSFKSPIAT